MVIAFRAANIVVRDMKRFLGTKLQRPPEPDDQPGWMQVAQYCGRRLIEMKSRQPETQRIMEESRSSGPVMQYQKASDKRQFLLLPEFVPDARPFALTAHCNQPSALDV